MQSIAFEHIRNSVASMSTCGGLGPVFEYLDERQPHLTEFSILSMEGYPNELGIKALLLGWLALKCFEGQAGGPLPVCSLEKFMSFGRSNAQLLNSSQSLSEEVFAEIMALETSGQPILMETLRSMIREHFNLESMQPSDIRSLVRIYLTLKSIVEALDSETN